MLEAIKIVNPKIKFYQAGSSEMYGKVQETPQTETTPFYPRSPYGVSKVYAHWITKNYRESFNLFAANGILFNHESPRRSEDYVTQKIVKSACEIYHGKKDYLFLGDLKAKIDWGYAKDYVECAWKIMQLKKPDFFVIATGKTYSVEYFVKNCFSYLGMDFKK